MKNLLIVFILTLIIAGCAKQLSSPREEPFSPGREIAKNVDLIYSDSAIIKFRIRTPRMETFMEEDIVVEEYPKGLKIEFYDGEEVLSSTIEAKYAKRESKKGTMTLRDSVVLVNALGDRLITTGIVWNELDKSLKTSKFVQLIKSESQDTFYGFGFEAEDDFSRFSIAQMTGKRRYQNLSEELGLEDN